MRKYTPEQVKMVVVSLLRMGDKKSAARILWPWMVQNEHTDLIWKNLDENRFLCVMGHGSASKTFTSAAWFLLDWWTRPHETAVLVTSDTIDSMNRRVWSDIKTLWHKTSVPMGGTLLDSKRIIYLDPIDKKNAIAGIAAESDDSQTKIQGTHTKYVRVLIDEADNKYSQSIWNAISNLGTSGEIKVVALANPANKSGEFGRHCEPKEGWLSINPELDYEWEGKLGWKVLRLDGLKSPNIVLGWDKYPFLLTNKGVQDIKEKKGELSSDWWAYVRAWYPPEGSVRNIFSPDLFNFFSRKVTWYSSTVPIGACDPAFEGGDVCMLGLGKMGREASDPKKVIVSADHFIRIKRTNQSVPVTIDYGDQIIKIIKNHGVKAENFGIDSTGTAAGLADYIAYKMGKIIRCGFGDSPTKIPILSMDSEVPEDRYNRLLAELWFACREWLKNGQLICASPPKELLFELENRTYELLVSSGKIKIESKEQMKSRGLGSPDHADMLTIFVHVARLRNMGTLNPFGDRRRPLDGLIKKAASYQPSYGISNPTARFAQKGYLKI